MVVVSMVVVVVVVVVVVYKAKQLYVSLSLCSSWNGFTFLASIFSIGIYWLVLLVESFIPSTIPHQYYQFGMQSCSLLSCR
jgi:hypothetical protein